MNGKILILCCVTGKFLKIKPPLLKDPRLNTGSSKYSCNYDHLAHLPKISVAMATFILIFVGYFVIYVHFITQILYITCLSKNEKLKIQNKYIGKRKVFYIVYYWNFGFRKLFKLDFMPCYALLFEKRGDIEFKVVSFLPSALLVCSKSQYCEALFYETWCKASNIDLRCPHHKP